MHSHTAPFSREFQRSLLVGKEPEAASKMSDTETSQELNEDDKQTDIKGEESSGNPRPVLDFEMIDRLLLPLIFDERDSSHQKTQ